MGPNSATIRDALRPELEVERELGAGSVARVYLARETALRRLVAVKVLRPELATDEPVRARFEREAQAAARIRHSHVAAIYRIGRTGHDVPYIVMEYIRGRTLEDVLRVHGSLAVSEAVRLLATLADALAAAHRAGVIHRDLRPANVMLEEETGRTVLLDFGIAGLIEADGADFLRITSTGVALGKPSHVSPEQYQGERATMQSDVYAFGVLSYEVLTGHGPFGEAMVANASRTLSGEHPGPLTHIQGLSPRMSALLRGCLAPRGAHRPTSAELSAELGRMLTETGGTPGSLQVRGGTAPRLQAVSSSVEGWEQPRLAAIWFADLVGFSTLAASDERAALDLVQRFQQICIASVEENRGRIVKFTGDGAFAEFSSTEAAANAARAVMRHFAESGGGGRQALRIGIHVADLIRTADGDLLGDGVNVAARLEQDARPGEILVSGDVRRQLRSRPAFIFRSLGARQLRGSPEPVEVYSLEPTSP